MYVCGEVEQAGRTCGNGRQIVDSHACYNCSMV